MMVICIVLLTSAILVNGWLNRQAMREALAEIKEANRIADSLLKLNSSALETLRLMIDDIDQRLRGKADKRSARRKLPMPADFDDPKGDES